MNNGTSRRKYIAVVLLVVLVVAIGLLQLIPTNRQSGLTVQAIVTPNTFSSAAPFNDDSVVFSNGQSLDSYNFMTGQTQQLSSSSAGLNAIDTASTSPNGQYVIFHDELVSPSGSLAAQLQSQGLNPSLDYWWVFNTGNKTFQPLPQGILMAKISNTGAFALVDSSDSGESITTYQLPGLQKTASIKVVGSSSFFAAGNGFVLQTPNSGVTYTTDGVVYHQILSSGNTIGISSDGQTVLAVLTQSGSRNLVAVSIGHGTTKTIAMGVVGSPVLSGSDVAIYVNNLGQVHSYNLSTKKTVLWNITDSAAVSTNSKNIQLDAPLSNTAALINIASTYYIVGNNISISGNP